MEVVIYARYSSDRQNDNTIDAQLRYCHEYCDRHDYKVIKEYVDKATSASSHIERRTQFLQMIKDSDKRMFEGVVVYKLDRFARNRYDSATYKNRLHKNGVQIFSASENISGDKESIILESVLEGMAEYFSRNLAENVTNGMREKAYQCNYLGGVVPFGFSIVDHKYVINEKEAPYVLEAFTRYAKGEKMIDIYDDFNRRHVVTRKGKPFGKNSFQNMFPNEKYKGLYIFQDIVIEHGIPSIVSDELWDKVQQRVKARKQEAHTYSGQAHAKVDYLLSCKLYCGKCGNLYYGETGTSKNGERHYYYTCHGHKGLHICDSERLRKSYIENYVCDRLVELLTPEVIDKLADIVIKEVDEYNNANDTSKLIQEQITSVENKINNLLVALEKYQSDNIINRLKELEKEKKALLLDLKNSEHDKINLTKDMIMFYFEKLTKDDITNKSVQRQLVDIFVSKVVVNNDNIEISYNMEALGFPT